MTGATSTSSSSEGVRVLDTTLCSGTSLGLEDRLEIAAALEALGVDAIEAGAPCASTAERRAVRALASAVRTSAVSARVRAHPDAVDAAWEALAPARRPRLHVCAAATGEHASGCRAVERARRYTDDVQFSALDAFRLAREARAELARAVLTAGARTLGLVDPSGCARPDEVAALVAALRADVPELADAVLAFRGHNDLGLASAGALAAVAAGARQVEASLHGLGERAGGAALEEVVVALAVHGPALGVHTRVQTREIARASRVTERCSGVALPAHKPVVGRNVFQSALGGAPEALHPVERERGLSRLAGARGFAARVRALGIELASEELERAFERFERTVDAGREAKDAELRRICSPPEAWPGPGI
jgi:2-isopropylmalate synthase